MIVAFLLLVHAFLLTHFAGVIALGRLTWLSGQQDVELAPGLANVAGLAVLALFISLFHFLLPIDWRLLLLSWIVLVADRRNFASAWSALRADFKKHLKLLALLMIASVLSILARPGIGDIADYHLQAIEWAEHYRNVPGLGNFNRPLANNNWWFNLQALFGMSFEKVRSVYVLNALLYASVCLYFLESKAGSLVRAWRIVVCLFLALGMFSTFVGSVTPDYVITLLILLTVDLVLQMKLSEHLHQFNYLLLCLIISWALSIKLTAILLLPLLIVDFNMHFRDRRLLFTGAGIFLLYLIPWIAGNVIACGYLAYPINKIDLFSVDWKVPGFYFDYDRIVLRGWGRVSGMNVFESSNLELSQWLPLWFGRLDFFHKGLFALFPLSCITMVFIAWRKRYLFWPFIVLLAGFVSFFINGPHIRFLYGYSIGMLALAAGALLYTRSLKISTTVFLGFLVVGTCFVAYKAWSGNKLQQTWLHPAPYPDANVKLKYISGKPFYITRLNNACWDKFPSSYYFIYNIELRGTQVDDGFRIKR